MTPLLGFPLAAAMLASCLWIAYLAAVRLVVPAAPHARLSATVLLALWLQVMVFIVLSRLHLFRLVVAAPLWLGAAAIGHVRFGGKQALAQLGSDLTAARDALREVLRSPGRALLLVPGVAIVGSRLLRDLVSPPLAWDSFLYHLYNPARWIQQGGLVTQRGPDGWGYLEFFPQAGDVTWAWAMLPVRGDALIAPAGVLIWSACLLGGYSLARALGAERTPSGLAALAIGFIPAAANIMTSGYADDFVLAVFLLSGVSLARLSLRSSAELPAGEVILAGAGLGLLASAKMSGLPALGLGLLFIAWLVLRDPRPRGPQLRAIALSAGAACVVALPGYLRAWVETGSPFYPLTLAIGGVTIFPGNEELRLLYSGGLHNLRSFDDSVGALLRALAIPEFNPDGEQGGFGLGVFGLLALAPFGAWPLLRDRGTRPVTIFLAAAAVLPFLGLLSPGFLAHRTVWQGVIGRLVMAIPAVLAVFAARVPGRLARVVWALVLVLSFASCTPQGFCDAALDGMQQLAPRLVLSGLLAAAIYFAARRLGQSGWGALGAVLAFAAFAALPITRVRSELRYEIFSAHDAPRPAYQLHMLDPDYASAWTIWRTLDDGAPHRVALSAGWDTVGHNWFRYPLMGSRLQNELVYVPIAKDGAVIDYRLRDEVIARADYDSWVARLVEQRIDHVVILYPWPLEQRWMKERPDRFEEIATGTKGKNLVFRFHPEPR